MPTARLLSLDEYPLWDGLVASSPQASIFHTSAWNEMLCATAEQEQNWLPLVCEEKNAVQAGVILRCAASDAKKRVALPSFGYNGPILSQLLEYEKQNHTYHCYKIIKELLAEIETLVDCVVIQNQPEIWDIRPYKFQNWKVNTTYLHILPCQGPADWRNKVDVRLQTQIESAGEHLAFSTNPSAAQVRKFCALAVQPARLFDADHSRSAAILEKRIRWMLEKDVCRLATLTDQHDRELAVSLLILSRENHTIYVWKTICLAGKKEQELLPSLAWQVSLNLANGFERIDLGESATQAVSQLKDRLGGKLTPRFIAEFNK